jgi:hypothetical protein
MGGGGFIGGLHETGSLALLIATTINPESWNLSGGHGSIVQYHELLVVKNNQAVHEKIRLLLEMMRASSRENPPQNPGGAGPAGNAPAGGGFPGAAGPAAIGSPAGIPGGGSSAPQGGR